MVPHYKVYWKDDDLNKRCTLFLFPLGVKADELTIKVASGGRGVEVLLPWPESLLEPALALEKLQFGASHCQTIMAKAAVKKVRNHSTDGVASMMMVPLPFQVEEQFATREGHGLVFFRDDSDRVPGMGPIRLIIVFLMGVRDNYQCQFKQGRARTVSMGSGIPAFVPNPFVSGMNGTAMPQPAFPPAASVPFASSTYAVGQQYEFPVMKGGLTASHIATNMTNGQEIPNEHGRCSPSPSQKSKMGDTVFSL
jgi:hypothetical protein